MPAAIVLGIVLLLDSPAWPEEDLVQAVERVNASVVLVRARGRDLTAQAGNSVLVNFNEVGSGVLISPDGKVVTAAHVVQIADSISVHFLNGEDVPARILAAEPRADIAVLQLDHVPPGAQPAPWGDSSRLRLGAQIFIIGAPYGIAHSLSVGHVSGRHPPNTVYAEIPLASMGIALQGDATFERVRERWAQLRRGDEMRFTILRAGRVMELRALVP